MEDPDPSHWWLFINSAAFSIGIVLALIAVVLLLICSALISGSEVAFFSLNSKAKSELQENGERSAQQVIELLERPKRLLATILISNNFVNIAIVILSSYVSTSIFIFEPIDLSLLGGNGAVLDPTTQNFLVNVVAITFLILLFGEVIPKVYASKYPERLALLMAFPFRVLNTVFHPLSVVMVSSTSFIDKRLQKKSDQISVDELSHALEITSENDSTEDDQKILKGIVMFGNTEVKQIMTPRVDVIAFGVDTPFDDLVNGIVESGYSRIPIYREDFDEIEGVLYIKDLLPHIDEAEDFKWQRLIREPFYVPENKKIDDLLEEFQEKKIHLAIVVDEYGGSQGIISLEDVMEEIVGEIADEFDEDDLVYTKIDEHNYVFEAKTQLKDFYKVLEIDNDLFEQEKGDAETIGGFVVEISGKIPKKNERIKFEEYLFTIEAADKRRVKSVKITLPDEEKDEAAGNKRGNSIQSGFIWLLVILSLSACEEENYTPKPFGYFRVELEPPTYQTAKLPCPFSFEHSVLANVNEKQQACWFDLHYRKLDATIHFTYYAIMADSIKKYTEDARSFAMKHTVKADNIEESVVYDPASNVYGMIYNFEGSVASNYQFFLTDSTKHFIRAAMYFNTSPNPDSLAPMEAYIKEDLLHLIETFEWQESRGLD